MCAILPVSIATDLEGEHKGPVLRLSVVLLQQQQCCEISWSALLSLSHYFINGNATHICRLSSLFQLIFYIQIVLYGLYYFLLSLSSLIHRIAYLNNSRQGLER